MATGVPVPSATAMATVSGPVQVRRTRREEAPAVCTVTPDQAKGRALGRSASTTPRRSGWRVASRSAGWRVNFPASVRCSSGSAISAKRTPSGDCQARRRPWKAGP